VEALEQRDCPSGNTWAMPGYDAQGTRSNPTEHTLSPANVGQLGVAWSFPTAAVVTGTPAVAGGVVYDGDFAGNFYALNEDNGQLLWQWQQPSHLSLTGSPLVMKDVVVFGDLGGNIYGLSADTGATLWTVHPSPNIADTAIWGSATQVGKYIAIGVASNEEQGVQPGYQYTDNGSVLLLDPSNGQILWQTYTIPAAAYTAGWRGASVWSIPTYDPDSNLLYVSTGNYFQAGAAGTDPGTEDAVIALNASTGQIVWTNQLVHGDIWNGNIVPSASNPDADIADTPKIFQLADGTKVVSAGSKDGFYFVMNAATGQPINGPNGTQLEAGGVLGGLYQAGAVDQKDGIIFANGLNWPALDTGGPPAGGDLYAVSLDGKTQLWDFQTPAPNGSGVAIANGVVYFQSTDGTLYALNAEAPDAAHALLASIATGGNYSGPAVADGHVFLGTGYVIPMAPYTQYHNSITALGLPPKAAQEVQSDFAALGGALSSANLLVAAGGASNGQVNQAINTATSALDSVVGDLAAIINVAVPSLNTLNQDLAAYYLAVAGGNTSGAQTALANVQSDLGAVFAALVTPAVNQTKLGADETALFSVLNQLLSDEQAQNSAATSADTAAEFAALDAVFNDLLDGRYGLIL
jgi:polyvinyl alcohol dehydrogenase (cytochrome)